MKTSIVFCSLVILLFGCSRNSVGPSPSPASNTAKYNLVDANSIAQSYGKGLRLVIVMGHQVNIDGTSSEWQYVYTDTAMPHTTYWFHAGASGVVFDSTTATLIGSGIIYQTWFNSDSALTIAEGNGGSQFRTQNPHYTIVASVGEPVVPNPKSYWYITYRSTDDQSKLLALSIDANSGAVIVMNN